MLMNFSVDNPLMSPVVMNVFPVPLGPIMVSGNSCWMARFRKYSCLRVSDVGTTRLSPLVDGVTVYTLGR